MKQNIYDNDNFFKEYDDMRNNQKGYNANDVIEIPTFRSMLPSLNYKKILDLGCGYGENCKYFIENGAKEVLGIDISENMIEIANEKNSCDKIEYKVMSMEEISSISNKYDMIVSSLAIHYVEDFDKLCFDVYNLLEKDGYFIFSQENPVGTGTILGEECSKENKLTIGNKKYYLLSNYNDNGIRIVNWNNCDVIKYHRSFSNIINTLIKYFEIIEFQEPTPTKEMIDKNPKYINQLDKPYFLFVKVKKK